MDFKRALLKGFIEDLNRSYDVKDSWWRKMVDDDDAFILIRNNRLHVLVNGGLLMQVRWSNKEGIICEVHEDFLTLRNESKPYVRLDETSSAPINRVEGLKGFVRHYTKVKNRIKIFTGPEKQAVQQIALGIGQIIDLEIGLEGDKKEDASRKGAQRIDMAGLSDAGNVVFFEVKLFENNEIRSMKTPKVIGQLKKYNRLLEKFHDPVLHGYQQQMETYSLLKGRFFQNRFRKVPELAIRPEVRLIVTGFDGSQKKYLLPVIREKILSEMEWAPITPELIACGNAGSIKKNHLFKGIR